eukprot:1504453-Prymnesium_polylepis.2
MPRRAQLHATGRGVSITCSSSLVRHVLIESRSSRAPPLPRLGWMIAGHATELPTPDPARWGLVEAYPDALGSRDTCGGRRGAVRENLTSHIQSLKK